MSARKRLILFVEGPADSSAAYVLVKHLLTEMQAWGHVFLDDRPFQVGNVAQVMCEDGKRWVRYLEAARKRGNLGGILLLQDGDIARIRGEDFCPWLFGSRLAEWARSVGGGSLFSVATVFALMEYESWLIACADRLAGQRLHDDRPGIRAGTMVPASDLEQAPRDAKGWLDGCMEEGYKNTRDQEPLTRLMLGHLDGVRARNLRGFRRLERALLQLVEAIRSNKPIVSPLPPVPAS
jgi:hypothetical protein